MNEGGVSEKRSLVPVILLVHRWVVIESIPLSADYTDALVVRQRKHSGSMEITPIYGKRY
jgi:hypothetical protein